MLPLENNNLSVLRIMKKLVLPLASFLSIFLIFSCTNPNTINERTIKITSDTQVEFDMLQNGVTTSGIKTPFEFKFIDEVGDFIFKSENKQNQLKLNLEDNEGSLSANGEIIVLVIKNDEMKTFVMN